MCTWSEEREASKPLSSLISKELETRVIFVPRRVVIETQSWIVPAPFQHIGGQSQIQNRGNRIIFMNFTVIKKLSIETFLGI